MEKLGSYPRIYICPNRGAGFCLGGACSFILLKQLHIAVAATHGNIAQLGGDPYILGLLYHDERRYVFCKLQQCYRLGFHNGYLERFIRFPSH